MPKLPDDLRRRVLARLGERDPYQHTDARLPEYLTYSAIARYYGLQSRTVARLDRERNATAPRPPRSV